MPSSERQEAQHYWESPYIEWESRPPKGWEILIFHMRISRLKARVAAVKEALCLLRGLDAAALSGGPLADQGGIFWIALKHDFLPAAVARLTHLGYSTAVDLLLPPFREDRAEIPTPAHGTPVPARWNGKDYALACIYEEDPLQARERAPDRRFFSLADRSGQVRLIQGYRGDGSAIGRRALPVCDARLLANLVFTPDAGLHSKKRLLFLDPYAGAGGIIIEALALGFNVASIDIDPVLRHGLAGLGAHHSLANARTIPFKTGSVDAIATEPPYDPAADEDISASMVEMHRVMRRGGRMAVLCAERQAEKLRACIDKLDFSWELDLPINRKGTPVTVLAMQKKA